MSAQHNPLVRCSGALQLASLALGLVLTIGVGTGCQSSNQDRSNELTNGGNGRTNAADTGSRNGTDGNMSRSDHTGHSTTITPPGTRTGTGDVGPADGSLNSHLVRTAKPVDLLPDTEHQYRDGPFLFVSQPSGADWGVAAEQGYKTVIVLRPESELSQLGYDEIAAIEAAGLAYIHIPITKDSFSRADVTAFAQALASLTEPVVIHCSSSNRVGAMWAAYLALERHFDVETAIERGRAAGMTKAELELRTREVIAQQ